MCLPSSVPIPEAYSFTLLNEAHQGLPSENLNALHQEWYSGGPSSYKDAHGHTYCNNRQADERLEYGIQREAKSLP